MYASRTALAILIPKLLPQRVGPALSDVGSVIYCPKRFVTMAKFNTKKKPVAGPDAKVPLHNEKITHEQVRLVVKDIQTGKSTSEIMNTSDALLKARAQQKDLIMVNDQINPPIVKIDNFFSVIREKAQIKKVKVRKLKTLELKEMLVKANIADKDMNRKLEKVRQWLVRSAQVKVTLVSNFKMNKANPLAIDEALIKVTDMLEGYAASVQEPKIVNNMRKTFLVSPLAGQDLTNLHKRIGFNPNEVMTAEKKKSYKTDLQTQRILSNTIRTQYENATYAELAEAVAAAGNVVRELKKDEKSKEQLKPAVAKLLLLKELLAKCPMNGSLADIQSEGIDDVEDADSIDSDEDDSDEDDSDEDDSDLDEEEEEELDEEDKDKVIANAVPKKHPGEHTPHRASR